MPNNQICGADEPPHETLAVPLVLPSFVLRLSLVYHLSGLSNIPESATSTLLGLPIVSLNLIYKQGPRTPRRLE